MKLRWIFAALFMLIAFSIIPLNAQKRYQHFPRVKVKKVNHQPAVVTNPLIPLTPLEAKIQIPEQTVETGTLTDCRSTPELSIQKMKESPIQTAAPNDLGPIKNKQYKKIVQTNLSIDGPNRRHVYNKPRGSLKKAKHPLKTKGIFLEERIYKLIGYIGLGVGGALILGGLLTLTFGVPGLIYWFLIGGFFIIVAGLIFLLVLAPNYGD